MGFFSKKKKQIQDMAQSGGDGMVHVKGMMADPASMGGPSSASVAENDPIWEPIEGVGLEQYAQITKSAADAGITDEAGVLAHAEQHGVAGTSFQTAMAGWNDRMAQSMAVGQKFNAIYMGKA